MKARVHYAALSTVTSSKKYCLQVTSKTTACKQRVTQIMAANSIAIGPQTEKARRPYVFHRYRKSKALIRHAPTRRSKNCRSGNSDLEFL